MSQQLEQKVPQVIDTFEKDGSFFLRTFLLDSSVARNGMGVDPQYIPKHIDKFFGSPVILTPEFWHPHEFMHYNETGDVSIDLPEYRKLQEPYIVGKVIAVDSNKNIQQGGNTNYSATLEITDPKVVTALKHGKIPLYVSPSIYRVNKKDPFHSITDYEPVHIAIVNNPAYGFHKANIRAHCEGDKTECSRMLAQAGIKFCPEEQLSKLTNIFQGSSNSSLVNSPQIRGVLMSEQTNDNVQQQEQIQQPVTEEQNKPASPIEQKVQEQLQAHEKQQEQKRTPIGTPAASAPEPNNINPPGSEEQREGPEEEEKAETPCAKAQKEYETKLVELEDKIKKYDQFIDKFYKTEKDNKLQSKRSRIESVIPVNYADSEEERTKAIESLLKVEDEQLEVILKSFVIPATKNIRQGGMRPRQKVTDFVKPIENNKNVAQGGIAQHIDFEELDKILSFGYGGIVPKKNNSSEGGIA